MKLWQPLKVGDAVDVIAPGFSVTEEKLEGAIKFLSEMGLRANVPKDLFGPDVVCGQSDEIRWRHLSSAFSNSKSKAIWCLRGGYGAVRLIEKFAKFKKPKQNKLFIGYSDATTIHNHLNQFWRYPSLHGPLLDRLGQHTLALDQVTETMDIIFGNREKVVFEKLKPLNKAALKKTKVVSTVVGGNLKVVESSLGTGFCKLPQEQILFFEDIGERGYRVDRMLKHLQLAKYFNGVQAIVFGEFIEGKEPNGESIVDSVIERFAQEIKIPAFSGVNVGHGVNQRPLPFGTRAELICGSVGQLTVSSGADLK